MKKGDLQGIWVKYSPWISEDFMQDRLWGSGGTELTHISNKHFNLLIRLWSESKYQVSVLKLRKQKVCNRTEERGC